MLGEGENAVFTPQFTAGRGKQLGLKGAPAIVCVDHFLKLALSQEDATANKSAHGSCQMATDTC